MGFVVQVMHRSGAHPDPFIEAYAERRRGLVAAIEALRPHCAELARRLPEAEKQAAVAFARVQPKAAAELARRRECGGLARAILKEREQQHERAQHRISSTNTDGGGICGWGGKRDGPVSPWNLRPFPSC